MTALPTLGSTDFDLTRAGGPVAIHDAAAFAGSNALLVLGRLLKQASGALDSDREAARRSLSDAVALLNAETQPKARFAGAGLAPWQAKRAAQAIEDQLENGIPIKDLAALTRLSASHFSRAFKSTFGTSPHKYIADQRVVRAQRIMLTTDDPLCEIANACGFADQSHMSRVFRKRTGDTPHAWRRERAYAAA